MSENSDVLIIGAGPAGLTAAIYSAWLGLRTVVLDSAIVGGRAYIAPQIDNYPGFPEGIKGHAIVELMQQQAQRYNAQFRVGEEVVGLDVKANPKQVTTRKQTYPASALIIATGTQRRKQRVPGETEFLGRGVSYCAICDGPFFRHRTVAVVGNTEEAAIDALSLADLAENVTLVTQTNELNIEGTLLNKLRDRPNIEIIKGQVTEIHGNQVVRTAKIIEFDSQHIDEKPLDGVFVALGGVPLTAVVQQAGIVTDKSGCLTVDRQQRTNVEGVFAAGDCTCGGMQVVTAAGEGAMAAMRASGFVRKGSVA
jgi:thioredoxin reductase (NADPH)